MKRSAILVAAVLLGACTAVHYESPELAAGQPEGQTIAVLPFEMVFAGKAPEGLDPDEIAAIEAGESLAFQHALYNQLLDRSSAHRDRPILVRIQPVETTNRLLDQADPDLLDWLGGRSAPPDETLRRAVDTIRRSLEIDCA